ncbi:uncharacterized protein LOC128207599 [Mya arenaria]|uniref:uncharacterized protein LOC128207599 n=1 Tax=Mya arenaria TaxID=6604 RepID=UPI0022E33D6C|nr:uncharacterized protein LOC128207599 [Mya arenaria]XP_052766597.1 uncharacterized protein LOC128207599 [Mya arenaria]
MDDGLYQLQPFVVPQWAQHLNNIPKHIVKLSNLRTPIHKWRLPEVPTGFDVYIKRDDLTGTELSGNKVRNLQILFAEALASGARHVVTGGGPQSGHCRAVSIVCRYLGIQPHVVIEGVDKREDLGSAGNTLLYRLAGSQIYLAPYEGYEHFTRRVRNMQKYISDHYQEPCYCIPVGGSAVEGVFGFVAMFQELLEQGLHENFDDIVVTIATGGTAAGLALSNYLTGSKLRVHAMTIALRRSELEENIDRLLTGLGAGVRCADILHVIEGHVGAGYGTASTDVLEYITRVSSSTGILLDPYYTGKAALGLARELRDNPGRFKGTRILFVHTGGIFGLFNGEMDRVVDSPGSPTNRMTSWLVEDQSPLQQTTHTTPS